MNSVQNSTKASKATNPAHLWANRCPAYEAAITVQHAHKARAPSPSLPARSPDLGNAGCHQTPGLAGEQVGIHGQGRRRDSIKPASPMFRRTAALDIDRPSSCRLAPVATEFRISLFTGTQKHVFPTGMRLCCPGGPSRSQHWPGEPAIRRILEAYIVSSLC